MLAKVTEKAIYGYKGFKKHKISGEIYCNPGGNHLTYKKGINKDIRINYRHDIRECGRGIHFCEHVSTVDEYYSFDRDFSTDSFVYVFAKIKVPVGSYYIKGDDGKSVASQIEVVEFYEFPEFAKKYGKIQSHDELPKLLKSDKKTRRVSIKSLVKKSKSKWFTSYHVWSNAKSGDSLESMNFVIYPRDLQTASANHNKILTGNYIKLGRRKFLIVDKVKEA